MNTRVSLSWLACAALCLTQVAHAAPGPNHYYPRAGYVVHSLPYQRHVIVAPSGGHYYYPHYYYSRGVWYAPHGPNYVVVHAPIGLYVPVLPPFYTTFWFGGFPYYYADNSYYLWREQQHSYEVVPPPDQAASSSSTGSGDVFMYPKDGQSADQQAKDRFECHRWASDETRFDPTQPGGGVADDQNASKRADYRRAISACLEGRGYSVK